MAMKKALVGMIALIASSFGLATDAQDVYIPDNVTTTGTPDNVLFGLGDLRYQFNLIRGEIGPNAAHQKVTEIAFVPSTTGTFNAAYCRITMGRGFSLSLTTCFTANAPCPVVVYEGPLTINAVADTWTAIGLQRAYVTDGQSNIVVDISYRGATGTAIPMRTSTNVLGSRIYANSQNAQCPQTTPENRIPRSRVTINNQNVLVALDHNHINFTIPIRIHNAPPLSLYYMAASFGQGLNGGIPAGNCVLGLDADPLFFVSLANPNSAMFQGYQGLIAPNGSDTGAINWFVPNIPALIGLCISHAAVLIDRNNGAVLGCTNTGVAEIQGLRS